MVIHIEDRQSHHRTDKIEIEKKAKIILEALGMRDVELSVLIVDDDQMAQFNKTYLDRSGPTNVMAFPMREGLFAEVNPNLLGDVVISLDTTCREAKTGNITNELRFDQLLIHGILHLLGFDHEKSNTDAKAMREKEEELLKLLQGQILTQTNPEKKDHHASS